MPTPVAENPLLVPHGAKNPSGSNTPLQGSVHQSFALNDVADGEELQRRTPQAKNSQISVAQEGDEAAWGSNFWVTLVDPQVGCSFIWLRKLTASRVPDTDVIFRMSRHWSSKLGSPSRQLCVGN
jgi:hypothetical protein